MIFFYLYVGLNRTLSCDWDCHWSASRRRASAGMKVFPDSFCSDVCDTTNCLCNHRDITLTTL